MIELDEDEDQETHTEAQIVDEAKKILSTVDDASRALQRLSILLQNSRTTNSIVMTLSRPSSICSGSTRESTNFPLLCGAPAEYLTVGAAVAMRKEKIERERLETIEKQRQKEIKAAERQERDAQKQKEREQRAAEKALRAAQKKQAAEARKKAADAKRAAKAAQAVKRQSEKHQTVLNKRGRSPTKGVSPFKKFSKSGCKHSENQV